jgi:KipI family sensor histidine kinase inhibitor
MTYEIRRVGLSACLVEVPAGDAGALAGYLRARNLPGVTDVVPGACTVLVDGGRPETIGPLLHEWGKAAPDVTAEVVEIPVTYDGADLTDVARHAGLSEEDVVALHTEAPMRVAFCGFAPGFAYIDDLPAPLRLPRLATPRKQVPTGSVAVAEQYTGVYPRSSPGGWRLIGRTEADLWNLDRDNPALLRPGVLVQFMAV